jgi:hypothetical protein
MLEFIQRMDRIYSLAHHDLKEVQIEKLRAMMDKQRRELLTK